MPTDRIARGRFRSMKHRSGPTALGPRRGHRDRRDRDTEVQIRAAPPFFPVFLTVLGAGSSAPGPLYQAEGELGRGLRPPQVCKKLGISEQTYYRWRKEYGGLRLDQAKRLKTLEQENARLKRVVADQALDHS